MFNYPPYGMWGAPQSTPMYFVPPVAPPNNPNATPAPQSWKEVRDLAKREIKREAKLRTKWEADEKKKKDGDKKTPPKASIPLLEGIFFAVLISPFIGLPTLKLYQTLFQMWGVALGAK